MRVVPPSGGARTEAAASCTSPRLLHVSTIFVTHFPCPRRCTVCTVFARCTAHGHATSNPCTPTLHCHGWPCHHTVHYRTPSLVGSPSNSITPHVVVPYDVSPNGFPIRLHLYPSSNPSQLYQLDLRIMDRSSALPMASHHEFKSVWNFLLLYNCLRKTPQVARSPIANTNPPNNYFNNTHPRVNINGTRDGMCDTKEGAPRVVVHLVARHRERSRWPSRCRATTVFAKLHCQGRRRCRRSYPSPLPDGVTEARRGGAAAVL